MNKVDLFEQARERYVNTDNEAVRGYMELVLERLLKEINEYDDYILFREEYYPCRCNQCGTGIKKEAIIITETGHIFCDEDCLALWVYVRTVSIYWGGGGKECIAN